MIPTTRPGSISTLRCPKHSLRYYAGLPRALAKSMLTIVNQGWSPEAWKAEQQRLNRVEEKLRAERARDEATRAA